MAALHRHWALALVGLSACAGSPPDPASPGPSAATEGAADSAYASAGDAAGPNGEDDAAPEDRAAPQVGSPHSAPDELVDTAPSPDPEAELRELRQVDADPSVEPTAVVVSASEPFKQAVPLALPARALATQHANASPWQCRKELARRKLPVKRYRTAKGIAVPVRLTGEIDGVRFNDGGERSPYSLLDCRLALLLDDFADVLAAHGVKAVRVDNYYRQSARLPGSKRRSQHAHGLAIDVTEFTLQDGRKLNVEELWGASIGEQPCGPSATLTDPSPEALILRNLVCNVARAGLFHHILTPCHDRAHRNHLHLDIKRGAKTVMIR